MPLNKGLFSSRQDWETPTELFRQLDGESGFDLGVCATEAITKCPAFFAHCGDPV
jgi:hypothetical protein